MNAQLPPRGPDDPDDLPDDAELKALYDRLPPSEPSPALDAAVLRAAAAGIPVARRRPRWPLAVATAATVVLAGGIAWRMRTEPVAPMGPPVSSSAPVAPTATAAATPPARELAAGVQARVHDKPSMMAAQAALADRPPAARRATGALKATREAAHAPRPPRMMRAAPPPAPVPMAPPQAPRPPLAKEPPAPPPPPSPPAPPSYAPLAVPAPAPIADNHADRTVMRETVSSASTREFARIRRLFERGETAQALAALKAFRQAHPDQSLPPDLRDRLARP